MDYTNILHTKGVWTMLCQYKNNTEEKYILQDLNYTCSNCYNFIVHYFNYYLL